MSPFNWIDPKEIRFSRTPGGRLAAVWRNRGGEVTAKRLFPMTNPTSSVGIYDMLGGEWGLMRTTDGLDPDSREALEDELRIRPFVPRIHTVLSLDRRFERFRWDALTDCGPVRFETGPLYEAVAHLPNGCRVVTDICDRQYVLPHERNLLRESRKRLARWL